MPEPMTADELAEMYPSDQFRKALSDLLDVQFLLAECKIRSSYKITKNMYDTLHLTAAGERMVQAFLRRGIKYPDAKFTCLLRMLANELLVDPIQTDTQRLVELISDQIRDATIRFPYTYGRLLYDRLLTFPFGESRTILTSKETFEVLEGTPQGVSQVGHLITGPFGLLYTPHRRSVLPTDEVPFHCADIKCTVAHSRTLTTDQTAPINEARDIAEKILEKEGQTSDWNGYFRLFDLYASMPWHDLKGDSLVYLLGDALTIEEMRELTAWLLDNTKNEVRQVAAKVGVRSGPAAAIVSTLNQAELLQLTLMTSDQNIAIGLDSLVANGRILVPLGQVRKPVIRGGDGSGWYQLQPELGRFGIRQSSSGLSLAPQRLRRLVGQMYLLDKESERDELDWQLRGEDAPTLEAKIESYLQKRSPREAVSALLLARKSNFVVAASKIGLAEEVLLSDEDRVNAVLWKLGFPVEDLLDPHRDFWALHEKMGQVTRQSPINPSATDAENIRRYAASFFVKLEDLLKDSLLYTTWALTHDHFASTRPFVYRSGIGERLGPSENEALNRLRSADVESGRGGGEHAVSFEGKLTLYTVSRGFQVLADLLSSYSTRAEEYLRPDTDLPRWVGQQDLQEFIFTHKVPFLDLLPESRDAIIRQLRDISRILVSAEVSDARNDWFHARRSPVDIERLRRSLEAVRDAVLLIQDGGYSRQVYRRVRDETDEADRATYVLADATGQEVVFFRPSRYAWNNLPALYSSQHVMLSARFAEPMEVLRFRFEVESPYTELWQDYPVRLPSMATTASVIHANLPAQRHEHSHSLD
ncbi:hypothetical protein TPA0907_49580 [Micromonospora humidisoli]|uniref:hypothetical protein n=1 Tax=Micromonospora sp. AKA109 TaxID=2733865 RepID=UPI0022C9220D|nr:hypothetical protein [Micromonospora sp. AKA109]GHJ10591.1 hypothetical protein TPA0907_49580 [Micromonospora sp. AKA109]